MHELRAALAAATYHGHLQLEHSLTDDVAERLHLGKAAEAGLALQPCTPSTRRAPGSNPRRHAHKIPVCMPSSTPGGTSTTCIQAPDGSGAITIGGSWTLPAR